MKKTQVTIKLTEKQAVLIKWALAAGREQNAKLLFQDDWDAEFTKKERYEHLWSHRKFNKAIKLFETKMKGTTT